MEVNEQFYNDVIHTFSFRVLDMSETKKTKQNIPSKIKLKHITICWLEGSTYIDKSISMCDALKCKRSELFPKILDIVKELNGSPMVMDVI